MNTPFPLLLAAALAHTVECQFVFATCRYLPMPSSLSLPSSSLVLLRYSLSGRSTFGTSVARNATVGTCGISLFYYYYTLLPGTDCQSPWHDVSTYHAFVSYLSIFTRWHFILPILGAESPYQSSAVWCPDWCEPPRYRTDLLRHAN